MRSNAAEMATHWGVIILQIPAPVELAAASQNREAPMALSVLGCKRLNITSISVSPSVTKALMAAITGTKKEYDFLIVVTDRSTMSEIIPEIGKSSKKPVEKTDEL